MFDIRSATTFRWRRPSRRSLDLRALLQLRSRRERSTVASRVLPVASMGFSFQSVSCPTRHSSELRALSGRQADRWGTSRSPWANPGPAATVADGADRLCRAEPASRTPRRASLAETADTSLRKCHPLCSCWRRRTRRAPCAPSDQRPKALAAPTLRGVLSTQHTGNPHEEHRARLPETRGLFARQALRPFARPRG